MNRDRTPPRSYRYDDEEPPYIGICVAVTMMAASLLCLAVSLYVVWPR